MSGKINSTFDSTKTPGCEEGPLVKTSDSLQLLDLRTIYRSNLHDFSEANEVGEMEATSGEFKSKTLVQKRFEILFYSLAVLFAIVVVQFLWQVVSMSAR